MTGVSRRTVIAGSALAAVSAATAIGAKRWWPELGSADGPFPSTGKPYCMAMHVHASFSEGPGSMEAQLDQAVRSGVDVIWWTEHDHRMRAHGYQQEVTFGAQVERENDLAWRWIPSVQGKPVAIRRFGPLADPPPGRSRSRGLRLGVTGTGTGTVEHRLTGQAENDRYRASLDGQVLEIDIFPVTVSAAAYLAIEILSSHRPRRNGRSAGRYRLSYRVGGGGLPGARKVRNRTGIVALEAPTGQWTTLRLIPADDLGALWPGLDGRDASMFELSVVAVADGKQQATADFAGLRFLRTRTTKTYPLRTQADLMTAYSPQFPTVRQIQALELSLTTPHLGWYGGKLALPDLSGREIEATQDPADATASVAMVHRSGGLASYNHPFGTDGGRLGATEQLKATRIKAAEMIANRALKCDLLEVGYRLRGGCDLSRHVSLWDSLSRNAVYLTGTGVSDDHKGIDWSKELLNFVTWAWATGTSTEELLAALRGGRAYFGDPNLFRGSLDMLVDDRVRMGSVSVSGEATRTLRILTTGLPDGGRVETVQGIVDRAGPDQTDPPVVRTALDPATFDRDGVATVEVDTSKSVFVRVEILTKEGIPAAFGNPVWLLRDAPAKSIPKDRAV
ncbi:hypothetical protein [Kribbella sp. CA-294648]|uniref:hypothetical protein n=1 Tax=Kribbella sp. CA-294648 TaxID=3239948 RepID=UPI003D8F1500